MNVVGPFLPNGREGEEQSLDLGCLSVVKRGFKLKPLKLKPPTMKRRLSSVSWGVVGVVDEVPDLLMMIIMKRNWDPQKECYPQNGKNDPVLAILGVPKMALRLPESKF